MEIFISFLLLLATSYQLYLQRVHNEKSLLPLGQIDLLDRKGKIAVCVTNSGIGPMKIDRLTFFKEGNSYTNIENCLSLNSQSYQRIPINEASQKVILPNASLEIFAAELEPFEEEAQMENIRKQLSPITVRVHYRDIYDNKFTTERNLEWFTRYITDENSQSDSDSGKV